MENVEIKVQEMDYSGTEAYKSLRTNLQFCGEDKKGDRSNKLYTK